MAVANDRQGGNESSAAVLVLLRAPYCARHLSCLETGVRVEGVMSNRAVVFRAHRLAAARRRDPRLISGWRLPCAGTGQPDADWVAGISIGAINSALIAGNSPDKGVERLRKFCEAINTPPFGIPDMKWIELKGELPTARSIRRAHWEC